MTKSKDTPNIENLKEGDTFKDYTSLCKSINIKPVGGDAKKERLEDLKRYFEYEKKGREFKIMKIYNSPLQKIDGRSSGNNTVYLEDLKFLLLNYLARQRYKKNGTNSVEMTIADIAIECGMCSENYINKTFEDIKKKHPDITRFDDTEARTRLGSLLYRNIRNLLDKLENDDFTIAVTKETKIKEYITNEKYSWRFADKDEKQLILTVKNKVLERMRFNSFRDVVASLRTKEFFNSVNQLINEWYGWDSIYDTYLLSFTDTLEENIEKHVRAYPRVLENRLQVNQKVLNSIDKSIKNKYDKNAEDYKIRFTEYWGTVFYMEDEKKPVELHKDYIKNQKILSDILVKIEK